MKSEKTCSITKKKLPEDEKVYLQEKVYFHKTFKRRERVCTDDGRVMRRKV